jgi:2Fe-2S ferredoxin
MPKVHFKDDHKTIEIKHGDTVLLAAKKGRVALNHKCGGKGSCTTCKVKIDDQAGISEVNHLERRMISETNLEQGQRLGCQVKVYEQVDVHFLEDPLKALIRRQLAAQQNKNNE